MENSRPDPLQLLEFISSSSILSQSSSKRFPGNRIVNEDKEDEEDEESDKVRLEIVALTTWNCAIAQAMTDRRRCENRRIRRTLLCSMLVGKESLVGEVTTTIMLIRRLISMEYLGSVLGGVVTVVISVSRIGTIAPKNGGKRSLLFTFSSVANGTSPSSFLVWRGFQRWRPLVTSSDDVRHF